MFQKLILPLILLLMLPLSAISSTNGLPLYLTLEAAGSGGLGSFNLEGAFIQSGSFTLYGRAGFSLAPIDANNGTVLVFPLMVQAAWGNGAHRLEAGIGQTLSVTTKGSYFILMPMALGYRFEPPGCPLFIRVSYTPIVSWLLDTQWQHWGGLTIGFRLRGTP